MNKFNPGDYIVTDNGLRGYVVQQLDEAEGYVVRLCSGYVTKKENELSIDELLYETRCTF